MNQPLARLEEAAQDSSLRPVRRLVDFAGFGLLSDGTTFGIQIRDLSYDGCRIGTDLALIPGMQLRVSVSGMGSAVDAAVQWYRTGQAGLLFYSEESRKPEVKRQHVRTQLTATLSLRRSGQRYYEARIFDLTPTGCRVEFVDRPTDGELMWVKFAGLDSIEAKVRWIEQFYGGIEFLRPIHPAVFELLLMRLDPANAKVARSLPVAPLVTPP